MQPFEIGLSLTGTVSAGAYTGGVIDFIIEALEQWELEKEIYREKFPNEYSKWDTPWHDVIIKGLSGASGGGVTCGLILNSIGKSIKPVKAPIKGIASDNDFYNSWVNDLGIKQLLETKDLTSKKIKSVFNGDAIPDIANNILKKDLFGNSLKRKYVDPHLTALITLTNLRGIPYHVSFEGAVNPILYLRHTDYAQFELAQDSVLSNQGSYLIPYDTNNDKFDFGYSQLKAACLATSAFPAAFKAQPFNQNPFYYYERIKKCETNNNGLALPMETDNGFMCSDGGVLNTEPFELLHKFMLPDCQEHNPSCPEKLVRTIIMVAPLETFKDFDTKTFNNKDDLLNVLPEDVFAIREEALYSAEEINKAYDENIYSRFIVAPVRNDKPGSTATCLPAITGTTLGTFGAFLSRDFREHDYFLGRRNAQLFLRKHFAIPVDKAKDNPIFKSVLENEEKFKGIIFTEANIKYFPIIPLCGTAKEEAYFPIWPKDKISSSQLETIQGLVARRLEKIIGVIVDDLNFRWPIKPIVSCVARKFEPKITNKIMNAIKVQLVNSDLASHKIME